MKKIVIGLLLGANSFVWALGNTSSSSVVFYGLLKGSINTYEKSITIDSVYQVSGSLTSGIKGSMPDRVLNAEKYFVDMFKKGAQAYCSKRSVTYYAVDNFHVDINTFGEYNNLLAYGTANVVCIK